MDGTEWPYFYLLEDGGPVAAEGRRNVLCCPSVQLLLWSRCFQPGAQSGKDGALFLKGAAFLPGQRP